MKSRLTTIIVVAALASTTAGCSANNDIPTYNGGSPGNIEHHSPTVHVVLDRNKIQKWIPTAATVDGYCYFHAANIALADGVWYAVNGFALNGIENHYIEINGQRNPLVDAYKVSPELTYFLATVNDRINDACP